MGAGAAPATGRVVAQVADEYLCELGFGAQEGARVLFDLADAFGGDAEHISDGSVGPDFTVDEPEPVEDDRLLAIAEWL